MNLTPIDWANRSWNPAVGCTKRCEYCYAPKHAKRQPCALCRSFTPHLHMSRLDDPDLRRKKPTRIFLGSMGELFDPQLRTVITTRGVTEYMPGDVIVGFILDRLKEFPQHTFIILTKRPDIAKQYAFPLNVWLGVSVENQEAADERIPQLLECNAALRFVSYEPAHGPVDFENIDGDDHFFWDVLRGVSGPNTIVDTPKLDFIIIGAETGNRKGKIVPEREWIEAAIDQARAARVPVFVKNNVVKLYPEFAGIREFPD